MKHIIWRFQIYNLFCEILKSRGSRNQFREIWKYLRKIVKSRNLYILRNKLSLNHVFQNDT